MFHTVHQGSTAGFTRRLVARLLIVKERVFLVLLASCLAVIEFKQSEILWSSMLNKYFQQSEIFGD
ncbi:hypothetical protein ACWGIE_21955 [Pseudomonas fulva]